MFLLGMGRAVAQDETEGFVQLISDEQTGQLLGAQMTGHNATEMIHIPLVAITAGLSAQQLKQIVFAHPSMSESIREAI